MKYINILLIILLLIIISYILINRILNNKEKFFTQILDNNFKILEINNELDYENCDKNNCNIVKIDHFKNLNEKNNEGIYYQTLENNIYIIKNFGGPAKLKKIIENEYKITSIKFSNDSKYVFVAVKIIYDNSNKIYYSNNYGNNWYNLNYISKNIVEKILEYKEALKSITNNDYLKEVEYFDNKNKIIDNIEIIYKYYNGYEIPEKILFSTYGINNLEEIDRENSLEKNIIYETEMTLNEIILSQDNKNFSENNNDIEIIYDNYIQKIYYEYNYDEKLLIRKKIDKIESIKNKNFLILVKTFKMKTLMEEEIIESKIIFLDKNYKEADINLKTSNKGNGNIFDNEYITDFKYYEMNEIYNEKMKFLVIANLNYGNRILFLWTNQNLLNVKTVNSTILDPKFYRDINNENEYGLLDINYRFETYRTDVNPDLKENKIKLFDIDYKIEYIDQFNKIKEIELYVVDYKNKLYKKNLNLELNSLNKFEEIKTDHIDIINNLLIIKKKEIKDVILMITDNKNIYTYNTINEDDDTKEKSNWNKMNSYVKEYSNYNKVKFTNTLNNTNKIVFNGSKNNTDSYKIYTVKFLIDKYVNILAVGGGGGGGYGGGGGGGGAIKLYNNLKLPAGTYKIIVGSGGKGGINREGEYLGKYGYETSIERLDDDDIKFNKIIVAGGGGGGSYEKNSLRPPITGNLGDYNYSSGGGGGGGGKNKIGAYGNEISGSGGVSYEDKYGNIYGGGGGSGGLINLENNKLLKYNNKNSISYDGTNATENSFGLGGNSIVLPKEKFELPNEFSRGGNGGFFGELNESSITNFLNKKIILDNNSILGKGGNGNIVILNKKELDFDIDKKYLEINTYGSNGVLIIYGTEKKDIEDINEIRKENIKNLYGLDFKLQNQKEQISKEIEYIKLIHNLKNKEIKNYEVKEKEFKKYVNELERKTKKFKMDEYNQNLNDSMEDSYLPYSTTAINKKIDTTDPIYNINRYNIIKLYQDLLLRQPTNNELIENARKIHKGLIDMTKLRRQIVNSDEYQRLMKLQSNNPDNSLIYSVTKDNINAKISLLYKEELNNDIPLILLGPLKDIYNYLQYNEYLLRAVFVNSNFPLFVEEIEETKSLKKNDIVKLFNKHFNLNDLKSKANDIQRYDKYNKINDNNGKIIESNVTDKYSTDITYSIEKENENLSDLSDLVLKDNYNYYLWDNKTNEEIQEENKVDDEFIELQQLNRDVQSTITNSPVIESFTNYNTNLFKKSYCYDNIKNLVSKQTYEKLNNSFTNNYN